MRFGLVAGVLVLFGGAYAGLWSVKLIGYERVPGAAGYQLEGVVGPTTGPQCPVDKRYVDEEPTGLRDDVLAAFQRMRAQATAEKVVICVNDGKRSTRQQQAQFDEYVQKYGTRELARQYVLPPEESMHVKGVAVDVQPLSAAGWVERSAGKYGFCRRYDNEPWHFEYDPSYVNGCPPMLPHA